VILKEVANLGLFNDTTTKIICRMCLNKPLFIRFASCKLGIAEIRRGWLLGVTLAFCLTDVTASVSAASHCSSVGGRILPGLLSKEVWRRRTSRTGEDRDANRMLVLVFVDSCHVHNISSNTYDCSLVEVTQDALNAAVAALCTPRRRMITHRQQLHPRPFL